MKLKPIMIALTVMASLSLQASAALKVTTTVNGSELDKTTERLTFSGETVTLHFADGTAETYDNDAVQIAVDFNGDSHIVDGIITQPVVDCKVYDLNGKFLGTSTARLPEGVYIVNGKKVYVKK